jgi:RNA polymerase sigma-70 factor (ECF subfamily)
MQPGDKPFDVEALPYQRFLFAQAYRYTGNAADADDLLQETLIRGWKKFSLFQPGTNLRAWLARIMLNVFRSAWRKRKRGVQFSRLDGAEPARSSADDPERQEHLASMSADEIAADEGFLQSLDSALVRGLSEIDERYREVLLLRVIGELPYGEVARCLHIPRGTVMSRLHRARAALRRSVSNPQDAE